MGLQASADDDCDPDPEITVEVLSNESSAARAFPPGADAIGTAAAHTLAAIVIGSVTVAGWSLGTDNNRPIVGTISALVASCLVVMGVDTLNCAIGDGWPDVHVKMSLPADIQEPVTIYYVPLSNRDMLDFVIQRAPHLVELVKLDDHADALRIPIGYSCRTSGLGRLISHNCSNDVIAFVAIDAEGIKHAGIVELPERHEAQLKLIAWERVTSHRDQASARAPASAARDRVVGPTATARRGS